MQKANFYFLYLYLSTIGTLVVERGSKQKAREDLLTTSESVFVMNWLYLIDNLEILCEMSKASAVHENLHGYNYTTIWKG